MPGAEARSPAGSRSYSQVQVLLSGRRGGAAPTAGVGRRLTLSAGCMDPRQRGTGWGCGVGVPALWETGIWRVGGEHSGLKELSPVSPRAPCGVSQVGGRGVCASC